MTRDHRLGLILVAMSTVAWSTAGLFTRAITQDVFTVLVFRGAFGTLGLLTILLARDGWRGLASFARLGRAGWLYAAISGVGMLCFITSLRLTSVAHVAIIYAVVPFLTAVLAWAMMGERPSRDALIACFIAFLGAVVMVGLGHDGGWAGDVLALAMTIGMALMVVIARKHPSIPTLPAGITSALISILLSLPLAGNLTPPGYQILLMAGFGIVNSSLGFALFLIGSTRIPPIETALLGALDAPLAPVWVWLVFAETPTPPTLIGAAIVMAAVFWHIARAFRSSPHP